MNSVIQKYNQPAECSAESLMFDEGRWITTLIFFYDQDKILKKQETVTH